jgi:hypothetical protein
MSTPNNLLRWLDDHRSQEFLGHAFRVKLDCLALLAGGGGSVADIATEHAVTEEAVRKHLRHACKCYGLTQRFVALVDLPSGSYATPIT